MTVETAMRPSRRARCARVLDATGLTNLATRTPHRDALIVLNYHRIGDAAGSPYYQGVFSATAAAFEAQVRWLAAHFHVVTLDEALEWLDASPGRGRRRARVLITFDDGYRDNYEVAAPILRACGVQGTFFLATGFIGTARVPWWDRLAWAVARTRVPLVTLAGAAPVDVMITDDRRSALELLLAYCKAGPETPEVRARECEAALEVEVPPDPTLFMGWDEAAALVCQGMAVGAHTDGHEILARVPVEQQQRELDLSRRTIERQLGVLPTAFAYPEGARNSFTARTQELVAKAGFRAAFSYYGGVNLPGASNRYDVRRLPVVQELELPLFHARVALAAILGRGVI